MDLDFTSGEWLQKRRKALDLTRAELARCAGCSESALRKIETDERRPSKQLARLLASCLEIPLGDQPNFIHFVRGELLSNQFEGIPRPAISRASYEHPDLITSASLPAFSMPLIGRKAELSALGQLISDPNCRLLTITGLGGMGKTRLAVEVAANIQQSFRDGVYFVSLAALNSAQYILTTIAGVLGFSFHGSMETKGQLLSYLHNKSLLLVLDNFDCFLEAAGLLTDILQQSPEVKLLVTSRECLGLTGEWLFELQGLPVPPLIHESIIEDYDSAALFLQLARRKQAGFALSPEDKPAVARICRLLEGMPLGIELAASWVQVLSCQEILQEIERSLDFLAGALRDLPDRHHSLRAVFDHSWNLLTGEERQLLCGLTVFPGGFYRQAAEQVCQASLPILSVLVSKSLVRKMGGSRYDLHQLVRQYASGYLHDIPAEEARLRDRHSRFYLAWLIEHEDILTSSRQKDIIEQITFEIDNIRQAWQWAIEHQWIDLIQQAAWSLWYLFEVRGLFREGEAMFLQAIHRMPAWEFTNEQDHDSCMSILNYLQVFLASLEFRQGRIQEAHQILQQCIVLLQRSNDEVWLVNAFLMYGTVCMFMGNFQEATRFLQQTYTHARTSHRLWELCISTVLNGRVEYQLGNYSESYRLISAGLALAQRMGDPNLITFSITSFVETAHSLNKLDEIEALLHEGLQLAKDNGSRFTFAMLQEQLALILHSSGNIEEAHQVCEASIALYRELGDVWSLSRALNIMGNFKLAEEDEPQACRYFFDALKVAFHAQSYANVLDALSGIATVQANHQNSSLALELVYHILQSPIATHQVQNAGNRLLAEIEARLTKEQIQAAKTAAQAQSLDQIVEKVASVSC